MSTSQELIKKVQEKVLQFEASELSLSETETRGALINPIFTAIGWDMENPLVVRMEWRKSSGDRPVDYAFMINGVPKLLVEAERLKDNISDKKWEDQLLWYSSKLGVKWCALTNGNIIRVYNSLAEEAAADKLLFEVEIKTIDTPVGLSISAFMEKLILLSEGNLTAGKIDEEWNRVYTIRKVFGYLKDKKDELIDDIVKTAKLTKKVVSEVLDRVIELRESFLVEDPDNGDNGGIKPPPPSDKPWLADGEKWHLISRIKSKSMERLSDTAKRLLKINEIVNHTLPNVTGPHWGQKHYISFKSGNTIWLSIGTLPKTLSVRVKCEASQFSLEELSGRLGVEIFNSEAKFSEKFNLPSSIRKTKNEKQILLRIKPDFSTENEEFKKFLEEAHGSFIGE